MGNAVGARGADPRVLRACKAAVLRVEPSATVVLFGSRGRGDAAAHADYDLLVLVDDATTSIEDRILDAIYTVELTHDVVVSPLLMDRRTWDDPVTRAMPLHENIDRDGIAL